MNITKKSLREMQLVGTLIVDDQGGVLIRTSDGAVWDSSFEVIGNACIGIDNDHNKCVLRLMCPAQGEILIDGIPQSGRYIEIRFCGPWEYVACLNWFETMGLKAAAIKGDAYRGGSYGAS